MTTKTSSKKKRQIITDFTIASSDDELDGLLDGLWVAQGHDNLLPKKDRHGDINFVSKNGPSAKIFQYDLDYGYSVNSFEGFFKDINFLKKKNQPINIRIFTETSDDSSVGNILSQFYICVNDNAYPDAHDEYDFNYNYESEYKYTVFFITGKKDPVLFIDEGGVWRDIEDYDLLEAPIPDPLNEYGPHASFLTYPGFLPKIEEGQKIKIIIREVTNRI